MNNRLKKIQKAIAKQQLDAVLVRIFEDNNKNVLYLSGFSGSSAVLVIGQKKAFIVTDPRYFIRAREQAPDFQLLKMQRGKKQSEYINEALKLMGTSKKPRVGFEATRVSVDSCDRWKKELKATMVPTWHMVERLRQFKDAQELEYMRRGCRITCKVYGEVAEIIRPGMTENEVAFELDMRLRKHGAEASAFPSIVASGPNSATPHHSTGDRKLKAGEPVIMDFGGVFEGGYCSDITRTVFVPGKTPTAKMLEIYDIVLEANKLSRKALRHGMKWKDYDGISRDYITKKGYGQYYTHGLGHSLGLDPHDPFDYENDTLDVGTVITDEPGIYVEGVGGVRIEDDLIVTAEGAQRITPATYWKP